MDLNFDFQDFPAHGNFGKNPGLSGRRGNLAQCYTWQDI